MTDEVRFSLAMPVSIRDINSVPSTPSVLVIQIELTADPLMELGK
jgi:hypothetical protein